MRLLSAANAEGSVVRTMVLPAAVIRPSKNVCVEQIPSVVISAGTRAVQTLRATCVRGVVVTESVVLGKIRARALQIAQVFVVAMGCVMRKKRAELA